MPRYVCQSFASAAELLAVVCEDDLDPVNDAALIQSALDAAADALARWGAFRYLGVCTRTDRPCTDRCSMSACGCCEVQAIPLEGPVAEIVSVKIDGVLLDEDEYEVIDDSRHVGPHLMRKTLDGSPAEPWPGCQRRDLPSTEEGTFEIVYTVGTAPTVIERDANIELALAIIAGSPGRVVRTVAGASTLSGGGVTIVRDLDDEESTQGLAAVRRYVSVWNPTGDRVFSAAWSPDIDGGGGCADLFGRTFG